MNIHQSKKRYLRKVYHSIFDVYRIHANSVILLIKDFRKTFHEYGFIYFPKSECRFDTERADYLIPKTGNICAIQIIPKAGLFS